MTLLHLRTNRTHNSVPKRTPWERWAIVGLLIITALLYGIGASKNGYANSFYAAAVQAGTHSWKAFFFGSIDAANYITVDKPPASLWLMELSCRIFGFHTWSMLLPQVLAGTATVYLVYASVRRWFGAASGLIAGLVTSLTPVAALMFGFNNPDALLTLLLTTSVYAVIRALEQRRPVPWLALAALATGFAFNTKMLQGLIAVPVLGLVYLVAARVSLVARIKHLAITALVLAISVLWWPLAVSMTPAAQRPYIGSSTTNSVWNLILGYNGFGRLLGTGSGQGGPRRTTSPTSSTTIPTGAMTQQPRAGMTMQGPGTGGRGPGGSGFGGSTGLFRMFNSDFGPNIAWFIPAALLLCVTALVQRARTGRTDKKRAAYLLWGGYLLLHILVFNRVSGVIHPYYPVVLAPAIAALVGMGLPALVRAYWLRRSSAVMLPVIIALTAITTSFLLAYQITWLPWLRWTVLIGGLLGAVLLLLQLLSPPWRVTRWLVGGSLLLCLLAPALYTITTITVHHTGSIPSAGPVGTGMQGSNNEQASAEQSFVSYLLAHQGDAKWLVAVNSANESAPIQLSSGQPVMAIGGFNGSDDALSLTQLQALIQSGKLRYYAVSSTGRGGMGGPGGQGNSTLLTWIKAHGSVVSYGGESYTLYDLSQALS